MTHPSGLRSIAKTDRGNVKVGRRHDDIIQTRYRIARGGECGAGARLNVVAIHHHMTDVKPVVIFLAFPAPAGRLVKWDDVPALSEDFARADDAIRRHVTVLVEELVNQVKSERK